MKFSSALVFATLATTSAFAPSSQIAKQSAVVVRSTEEEMADEEPATESPSPVAPKSFTSAPTMSQSLPFMQRPMALDGSLVGDVGFDPLGFAKSKEDLLNFREAEIKHARLAMLAAAGWPISELFDAKLANTLGLQPLVDASSRAPSLLNGGLGKVSPIYWGAILAVGAAVDLYGIRRKQQNPDEYFPGNLGFDPLGLFPSNPDQQEEMKLKELKNGRLAMIAITGFAFQEFVSKFGVVAETPIFFKPFNMVIQEAANTGYILH